MKKNYFKPIVETKGSRIRTSLLSGSWKQLTPHDNPYTNHENLPIGDEIDEDYGFDARKRQIPFN